MEGLKNRFGLDDGEKRGGEQGLDNGCCVLGRVSGKCAMKKRDMGRF